MRKHGGADKFQRIQIVPFIDDNATRRAVLTVCSAARDAADARLLLEVLNLDPATGRTPQKVTTV